MEKVFSIGTGVLRQLSKAPELERGQIVFGIGYAGNRQMYAVSDPSIKQLVEIRRADVNCIEDLPNNYFGAIHTYDKYIMPLSEKYGIGFYYDDMSKFEPATDEEIRQGHKRALDIELWKSEAKRIDEEEFEKAKSDARKKYGKILSEISYKYEYKEIADNVRALLKHTFPSVKFSVRRSHGTDWYDVSWTDGPTSDKVRQITDLFNDLQKDRYNDDLYEHISTGFTALFGALDISVERNISKEMKDATFDIFKSIFDVSEEKIMDKCDLLNSAKTEIPDEIENAIRKIYGHPDMTLIEWSDTCLHYLDFNSTKAVTNVVTNVVSGLLIYNDYSEKAFAITGDTKSVSEKLKQLGGRFNMKLSCGPGWIFPKTKELEVRTELNI